MVFLNGTLKVTGYYKHRRAPPEDQEGIEDRERGTCCHEEGVLIYEGVTDGQGTER